MIWQGIVTGLVSGLVVEANAYLAHYLIYRWPFYRWVAWLPMIVILTLGWMATLSLGWIDSALVDHTFALFYSAAMLVAVYLIPWLLQRRS